MKKLHFQYHRLNVTSLIVVMAVLQAFTLFAQTSADYAVKMTARTDSLPYRITLQWPHDTTVNTYILYKKAKSSIYWTETLATLTAADSSFTDTNVIIDSAYEYKILAQKASINAFGYLCGGIKLHAVEHRGTLILLVDSTLADSLNPKIYRLMKDISGDGWSVIRHDVSRNAAVTQVKALIQADYYDDPANVKAVFLLGHVPVPYSGDINPDGHSNHKGAWPADVYYADMDGSWSDNAVNDTTASRLENRNIPGDGKFDQSLLPGNVELQVGRVDLSNMPAFPLNEIALLKRYLDKDHNFRNKQFTPVYRGLVNDNFGAFSGEAFASSGWRNFAPLVGTANTFNRPFLSTLANNSYIWAYGCGGGSYNSASGIGTTANFAADTVQAVFTMLFGSYFGDWDSQNNFLRAPLASATQALSCCWAGRPHWQFHQMAMGENLGYCTKTTQNNNGTYVYNYAARYVHIALMGDPSLRMHVISPPANLQASVSSSQVHLSWAPSPDTILGYYVYRSSTEFGYYSRISPSLVTQLSFTDASFDAGLHFYMVRAVKLEHTPSGSYYNQSTGITDSVTVPLGVARLGMPDASSLLVYPNPANAEINLEIYTTVASDCNITITDITGRVIIAKDAEFHSGQNHLLINSENLNPGFYSVIIRSKAGISVRKLEIIR